MRRLLTIAALLSTLSLNGGRVEAVLRPVSNGDKALVARMEKLIPAPFLRTDIVATVELDTPEAFFLRFLSDNVLGYYTSELDIHIRRDLVRQDRDTVACHEYGHFVYYNLLTFRERQTWDALWGREKWYGKFRKDEYRGVSSSEGFAEAFGFMCNHDYVDRLALEDDFLSKVEHRLADAL